MECFSYCQAVRWLYRAGYPKAHLYFRSQATVWRTILCGIWYLYSPIKSDILLGSLNHLGVMTNNLNIAVLFVLTTLGLATSQTGELGTVLMPIYRQECCTAYLYLHRCRCSMLCSQKYTYRTVIWDF